MQIVVVSSPGHGEGTHWSADVARRFAESARTAGAEVQWLCALPASADEPVAPDGVGIERFRHRPLPLHRVAASQLDPELERSMTRHLRAMPAAAVVHIGVGGRGTPNVLWLADRLGSRTYACLRGDELVCHRSDLVDRDGQRCGDWSDPERCRWCCSSGRSSRPRANDLLNRVDLFIAGLSTCEAVRVRGEEDVAFLTGLGVDGKRIEVGSDGDALANRVLRDL